MQVILHRLAANEFAKACRVFFRDEPFKEDRFREEVLAVQERIRLNPAAGSPYKGPYRWMRTKRFKYILFYRQINDEITMVFAVSHASRKPGYWLRRTRKP